MGVARSGALYCGLNGGQDRYKIQVGEFDFATGRLSHLTDIAQDYLESNVLAQWSPDGRQLIQQAAAKGQAVNALCQMTGLSRASFYRARTPRQATLVEMEIRVEIQKIAIESPAYSSSSSFPSARSPH